MDEESLETELSEKAVPSALNEMKDVTIKTYRAQLDHMRRYLDDLEKDMPVDQPLNHEKADSLREPKSNSFMFEKNKVWTGFATQ